MWSSQNWKKLKVDWLRPFQVGTVGDHLDIQPSRAPVAQEGTWWWFSYPMAMWREVFQTFRKDKTLEKRGARGWSSRWVRLVQRWWLHGGWPSLDFGEASGWGMGWAWRTGEGCVLLLAVFLGLSDYTLSRIVGDPLVELGGQVVDRGFLFEIRV